MPTGHWQPPVGPPRSGLAVSSFWADELSTAPHKHSDPLPTRSQLPDHRWAPVRSAGRRTVCSSSVVSRLVPSRLVVCRPVSSSSVVLHPVPSCPVPYRPSSRRAVPCWLVWRSLPQPPRLELTGRSGAAEFDLRCPCGGCSGGGGGAEESGGELTGRPARPSSGGGAGTAPTSAPPTRRCLSVSDVCVRQERAVDLHKYQAEPGPGGAARQTGSAHLPGAAGQRPLNGPFVPARPMGETRRRTNERLLSGTSLGDSGHGCIRDARRPGPPPADERNHRCRVRRAETPFPMEQRGLDLSTIFMPPTHTLMSFDGGIQHRLY